MRCQGHFSDLIKWILFFVDVFDWYYTVKIHVHKVVRDLCHPLNALDALVELLQREFDCPLANGSDQLHLDLILLQLHLVNFFCSNIIPNGLVLSATRISLLLNLGFPGT